MEKKSVTLEGSRMRGSLNLARVRNKFVQRLAVFFSINSRWYTAFGSSGCSSSHNCRWQCGRLATSTRASIRLVGATRRGSQLVPDFCRIFSLNADGDRTGAWAVRYDPVALAQSRFDILTLNDPFDLGGRFIRGPDSCLLHSRRMWSVVPNGDIYSCCFNVYQEAHKVGSVADPRVADLLSAWALPVPECPCRAFEESYWQNARPRGVTCPISAISVLKGKSLPLSSEPTLSKSPSW